MIRRPPRSTLSSSSAASDVYKRQLLENLICAYSRFSNSSKSFNIKGSCIYVYPSYFTMTLFNSIYDFDCMGNIFRRVIRMFSINQYQSLLAIILKSLNLPDYISITEGFPDCVHVGDSEATILTIINTSVPNIKTVSYTH